MLFRGRYIRDLKNSNVRLQGSSRTPSIRTTYTIHSTWWGKSYTLFLFALSRLQPCFSMKHLLSCPFFYSLHAYTLPQTILHPVIIPPPHSSNSSRQFTSSPPPCSSKQCTSLPRKQSFQQCSPQLYRYYILLPVYGVHEKIHPFMALSKVDIHKDKCGWKTELPNNFQWQSPGLNFKNIQW